MDLLKQMPYSMEAEQAVLGSIIINQSCLNEIVSFLKPEHFYVQYHKDIFQAMIDMLNFNEPIDVITVGNKINSAGMLKDINGKEYALKLMQTVPTASNALKYADMVSQKAILREMIDAAGKINDACYEGDDDARKILDYAEHLIYKIADGRGNQEFVKIKEALRQTIEMMHNLEGADRDDFLGIKTHFSDLDRMLVGINSTDLVLLAARPGMGKTSFALNLAYNIASQNNKSVIVFSLEMSTLQLAERMLSSEATVENKKMRMGELNESDWTRIAGAANDLSKTNIYFDDTAGMTVTQMKSKARRVKNAGLIVIDYLQLMDTNSKSDNRVQVVQELTRGLKLMAKDLQVPILCLSQLSRGPEARQNKRPMLSDLRESGSIEQDADIVMFLYRDDYYNKESEERGICECLIEKNRHGSTGKVKFKWIGECTKFAAAENRYDE